VVWLLTGRESGSLQPEPIANEVAVNKNKNKRKEISVFIKASFSYDPDVLSPRFFLAIF
jgi:hypothetical protein